MGRRLNYSGFVIAGIGFVLTRFTVTLALGDPVRFVIAGVVPLALGLGLAAFGVALVVADVEASFVRTTALWCVIGAGSMGLLVGLTVLGSTGGGVPSVEMLRSQLYLSNFLIGGSIGGTLTGLYAARSRRQHDELRQQANRLEVLNRMLRHEVLNAVAVIQGYASTAGEDPEEETAVIRRRSAAIAETVEDVRYLTRSATHETGGGTTDLVTALRASVATVTDRHPAASITVEDLPEELPVRATDRLEQAFTHLLDNAVVHADDDQPSVAVSVAETGRNVRVSVRDEGPGLPAAQEALLETGEITEFDDPRDGYGLNVVRLLVESFGGTIDVDATPAGSTITVTLARAEPRAHGLTPDRAGLVGLRLDVPHLAVTLGAALLAGVAYGVVAERLGGSVAAIGVFYGISDPVVGWLTHEFHSAVFAFMYAGIVSFVPARHRNYLPAHVAIGAAWGVVLWAGAAGVIAPLWLQLLGFTVPIPNLSMVLLATHLAWGVTLGVLTALGYRYVSPWLRGLRASGGDSFPW